MPNLSVFWFIQLKTKLFMYLLLILLLLLAFLSLESHCPRGISVQLIISLFTILHIEVNKIYLTIHVLFNTVPFSLAFNRFWKASKECSMSHIKLILSPESTLTKNFVKYGCTCITRGKTTRFNLMTHENNSFTRLSSCQVSPLNLEPSDIVRTLWNANGSQ